MCQVGHDSHDDADPRRHRQVPARVCRPVRADDVFVPHLFRLLARDVPMHASRALMMAVSCTKAMLVIMFFMHLMWEANWKWVLTIPASFMSIFLMLMLVPDIGWRHEQWLRPLFRGAAAVRRRSAARSKRPKLKSGRRRSELSHEGRSLVAVIDCMSTSPAVEIAHLAYRYGEHEAIRDLSLEHRRARNLRDPRPQRQRQDDALSRALDADSDSAGRSAHPRPRPAHATPPRFARSSASCFNRRASTRN